MPRCRRRIPLVIVVCAIHATAAGCARAVSLEHALPGAACAALLAGDDAATRADIEWLRPADFEDRSTLDRWCEGIGPGVLALHAKAANPRPTRQMVIVSWNTHVGGGDLARFVGQLRTGAFTEGRPVTAFVLLLQEVFRAGPLVPQKPPQKSRAPGRIAPAPAHGVRRDIVNAATDLGLSLLYIPNMRNGRACDDRPCEDRGNAVLTTQPLSDVRAFELPFERQRRVVIGARVAGTTPDGLPWTLRVMNAHLENRAGRRRLWLRSAAARRRQAEALAHSLPHDVPLVLGGDLNTWLGPLESALRILRGAVGVADESRTCPACDRPRGLDHVLVRLPPGWTVAIRTADDRFGSDHHPVIAVLTIQ
jgi:endonuclease/exonuclease/phosphatase family metal-dependent hydrolase